MAKEDLTFVMEELRRLGDKIDDVKEDVGELAKCVGIYETTAKRCSADIDKLADIQHDLHEAQVNAEKEIAILALKMNGHVNDYGMHSGEAQAWYRTGPGRAAVSAAGAGGAVGIIYAIIELVPVIVGLFTK